MNEAGKTVLLEARVLDEDGKLMSTKGLELAWSSDNTSAVKLSNDGQVRSVKSGEAEVTVEIVGTEIKASTTVEVKIPSAVHVSIDKMRLFEGETKEDVWGEVRTERGAYVEDARVVWGSEDSSVVKVEPMIDEKRRQSFVKLTGVKAGTTHVIGRYGSISNKIRVAVFANDQEINLVGVGISKKKARNAKLRKKKKVKPRRLSF